ncbi:unnamed protein product [Camellia sinensis]
MNSSVMGYSCLSSSSAYSNPSKFPTLRIFHGPNLSSSSLSFMSFPQNPRPPISTHIYLYVHTPVSNYWMFNEFVDNAMEEEEKKLRFMILLKMCLEAWNARFGIEIGSHLSEKI